VLLLESPECFLVLLTLLHQLLLGALLGTLVQDSLLLLSVESLEMVRLDSVSSEHGSFSCGVLSHEIMGSCEIDFIVAVSLEHPVFVGFLISLGLGHLLVLVSNCSDHGSAFGVVVVLSLTEEAGQVALLLVVHLVIESSLLSIKLLLSFLLGNPVGLL
jgi:hypothetical protein